MLWRGDLVRSRRVRRHSITGNHPQKYFAHRYVVAEQRRPSKQAATVVVFTMLPCNYLSMVFVGRLVWVARRKAPDDSAASVQPVKDEGLEAGGVFDVPGA